MKGCALAICVAMMGCSGPAEDRLADAIGAKRQILQKKCSAAGLRSLPSKVYLRTFKEEKLLEVWGFQPETEKYVLIDTYPIAAMSGTLGPKRKEGDRQVPEGLYVIDVFNPKSQYHLSMRINYPNASDEHFSDAKHPGGDIYIHGNQVSIGCLAMTDDKIKEIYVLAHRAKSSPIPVHVFPARLTKANRERLSKQHPQHVALWKQLEPAFSLFEKDRVVPKVSVTNKGAYVVKAG